MKVVWSRGSVTVRDVYEALLERRKVAYTTVMTMMKILEQKKYPEEEPGRNAPTSTGRPSRRGRWLARWFGTLSTACSTARPRRLLVHLVKEHDLSAEDLEEIARLRKNK